MEGVGARLGRSSTRYGPATVFTGPVRKWKKRWVHVSPSNASSNLQSQNTLNGHNGTVNGNNGSHLQFYKWTPITQSQNSNNAIGDQNSGKDEPSPLLEEPPRRKFKYIPIAVLEEQKNDEVEEMEADHEKVEEDEEDKSMGAAPGEDLDSKLGINDLPAEENQEENQSERQDLNKSNLNLSLNLNADGDDG